MEEDELQNVRRQRLADWLKANGGAHVVCERRGLSRSVESHISQILGGYSFASRAARSMEKKLGMDPGALDQSHATAALTLSAPIVEASGNQLLELTKGLCEAFDKLPNDFELRLDVVTKCLTIIRQARELPEKKQGASK